MASESVFTFSVDTEAKIKVDRASLLESQRLLDSFYNEYSNKEIDIGLDSDDLKQNISKANEAMSKFVRSTKKYMTDYQRITSEPTSWINADDMKDDFARVIPLAKRYMDDVRVVFRDGTELSGFEEIFKILDDGRTQFEKYSDLEGLKFVDLGDQLHKIKQDAADTFAELERFNLGHYSDGSLNYSSNDYFDQDDLERSIKLLEKLAHIQDAMSAFSTRELDSSDFISHDTSETLRDEAESMREQLDLLRTYRLQTVEELKARQHIQNQMARGAGISLDRAMNDVGDDQRYERNLEKLREYVQGRKDLLETLSNNEELFLYNEDGDYVGSDIVDQYKARAQSQIKETERFITELQNAKNKLNRGGDGGVIDLDFNDVLDALKEIKGAIEDIGKAFQPLTNAMQDGGSAFARMISASASEVDSLIAKFSELHGMVNSISNKDFNVTNVYDQRLPAKVVDEMQLVAYQEKATEMINIIKTLQNIIGSNQQFSRTAMINGSGWTAYGELFAGIGTKKIFDDIEMSGKVAGATTVGKIKEVIGKISVYFNAIMEAASTINSLNPDAIDLSMLDGLKAIDEKITSVGARSMETKPNKLQQTQQAQAQTENIANELSTLNGKVSEELASIRQKLNETFDLSTLQVNYEAIQSITDKIYQYFLDLQQKISSLKFNIKLFNDEQISDENKMDTQSIDQLNEFSGQVVQIVGDIQKNLNDAFKLDNITTNYQSVQNIADEIYKIFADLQQKIASLKFDVFADIAKNAQDSASQIIEEAKALKEIIDAANGAAESKKAFVEANVQVKAGADESTPAIKKEKAAMDEVDEENKNHPWTTPRTKGTLKGLNLPTQFVGENGQSITSLFAQVKNQIEEMTGKPVTIDFTSKVNDDGQLEAVGATLRYINEEAGVTVKQFYDIARVTEATADGEQEIIVATQSAERAILGTAKAAKVFNSELQRDFARQQIATLETEMSALNLDLKDVKEAAENINDEATLKEFNLQLRIAKEHAKELKAGLKGQNSLDTVAAAEKSLLALPDKLEVLRQKLKALGDVEGTDAVSKLLDDIEASYKQFNSETDANKKVDIFKNITANMVKASASMEKIRYSDAFADSKELGKLEERYSNLSDSVAKYKENLKLKPDASSAKDAQLLIDNIESYQNYLKTLDKNDSNYDQERLAILKEIDNLYGQLQSKMSLVNAEQQVANNEAAKSKKEYDDLARKQKELYDLKTKLAKAEYNSPEEKNLEDQIAQKEKSLKAEIESSEHKNALKEREVQLEKELQIVKDKRREEEEEEAFRIENARQEEARRKKAKEESTWIEHEAWKKSEEEKEKLQMRKELEMMDKDVALKEKAEQSELDALIKKQERLYNLKKQLAKAERGSPNEKNLLDKIAAEEENLNAEIEASKHKSALKENEIRLEKDLRSIQETRSRKEDIANKEKELNALYGERQSIISNIVKLDKDVRNAQNDQGKAAAEQALETESKRLRIIDEEIDAYGILVDEQKLSTQNQDLAEGIRKNATSSHIKQETEAEKQRVAEQKEAFENMRKLQKQYYTEQESYIRAEEGSEAELNHLQEAIEAYNKLNEAKREVALTDEQAAQLHQEALDAEKKIKGAEADNADTKSKQDFKQIRKIYNEYLKSQEKIRKMELDTSGKDNTSPLELENAISAKRKEELLNLGVDINNIEANSVLTQKQKNALLEDEVKYRENLNRINAQEQSKYATKKQKEQERADRQNKNYGKAAYNTAQRNYDKTAAEVELAGITDPSVLGQLDAYKQKLLDIEKIRNQFANDPAAASDDGLRKQFHEATLEADTLKQKIMDVVNAKKKMDDISKDDILATTKGVDTSSIDNIKASISSFVDEISYGRGQITGWSDDGKQAFATFKSASGDIENVTVALKAGTNELIAYRSAAKGTSTAMGSIKNMIGGELSSFIAQSVGIHEMIQLLKTGVNAVQELDLAMTELKKVTDETDGTYDAFVKNMSSVGSKIGSTVTDLTTMAAEWSRLGYTLEEAGTLAESTAVLMNVSEFTNATEASEALISTMQAFQYTAEDSQHVVDILNEVGNNYAVSSSGIATALQTSASALMEGGNNLEQATALVAAANRVVQDPASVGSALRTISLRLRGTSVEILESMGEEVDGVVESTSKLQEKLKALTGVDILTDAGAYKDTYTILKEIGNEWQNMSSMDQAAALELMAGKNRANTLSAILNNMKDLEAAYESAMQAEGSALKENEAFMNSIEGRIKQFNNATQTMWANFISDDLIKNVVSFGTACIQVFDQIGVGWTALLAAIAAVPLTTAFQSLTTWLQGTSKSATLVGTLSLNFKSLGQSLNTAGAGISAFVSAHPVLTAMLIALPLVVKGLDAIIETSEEVAEAASKAQKAIANISSEFKSNQETVNGLAERFAELAQGVDMLNGKNLTLTADDYEEFLSLSNQLAEIFPELSRHYDENGNAIVQLSGDTDTIVGSLQNLLDVQRQLAQQEIADNMPDLYKGALSKSREFNAQIEQLEKHKATYAKEKDYLVDGSIFENGIAQIGKGAKSIDAANEIFNKYRKIFQEEGLDIVVKSHLPEQFDPTTGEQLFGGYEIGIKDWDIIPPEDIAAVKDRVIERLDSMATDYDQEIENTNEKIRQTNEKNKTNWQSLSQGLASWLQTNDTYKILDDQTRSTVQNIVSNLDFSTLNFNSFDELANHIQTYVLDLFADPGLANNVSKAMNGMFDIKGKFQGGDMLLGEYQEQMSEFVNQIKDSSLSKDIQEQILKMFEIEYDDESPLGKSIETMMNHAKSIYDTSKETIESELKRLGEGGAVDLLLRPKVEASIANEKDWNLEKGQIATILTHTASNEDNTIAMNFTPIITDENGKYKGMLTPDEIQAYGEEVIAGVREDDLNLKIGTTYEGSDAIERAVRDAKTIHELHDLYFLNSSEHSLNDLTYSDLQIMNSPQFNVDGSTIASWEQLQYEIQLTRNAMMQDFTTDNFADYSENIKSITSNITAYQEALEKLESGTFTMSDFIELIEQFPDLAKGVDKSSKSFDGLSDNLIYAQKHAPDALIDSLKDLRQRLKDAGKSTDEIDALIKSLENLPTDSVDSLANQFSTLSGKMSEAKRAINELKEAMSQNPNEGFETRGSAIEQMKTLMEQGAVGSESEIWDIAKAFFGDNPEALEAIANKNADALYNLINARDEWYQTNKDGKHTIEGIENFFGDVTKATQSKAFEDKLAEFGLTPDAFKWSYDEKSQSLEFDFDNENWDKIVQALSATSELTGLASSEFADLLVQAGQFFNIKWGDANDVSSYIETIGNSSKSASEKLSLMTKVVENFAEQELGQDLDMSSLTEADVDALKCDESLKQLLKTYISLRREFEDPLGIETTLDGKKDLSEFAGLSSMKGIVTQNQDGTTVFDTEAFTKAAKEAGYTDDKIKELIKTVQSYENVISITTSDPLGLKNTNTSLDTVKSTLESLGVAFSEVPDGETGGITLDVNAPDLIETLKSKGWTAEQISTYLQTLTSSETGLPITLGDVEISKEGIDAAVAEAFAVDKMEIDGTVVYTIDHTAVDAYIAENKDAKVIYTADGTAVAIYAPENKEANVLYIADGTNVIAYTPDDKEAKVLYDADGNLVALYSPDDKEAKVLYTPDGTAINSYLVENKEAKVLYTPDGAAIAVYNPENKSADVLYDVDGTAVTEYMPGNKEAKVLYDADGNLVAMYTPEDKQAKVLYNADGTAVSEYAPEGKEANVLYTVDGTAVISYVPETKYAKVIYTPEYNNPTNPPEDNPPSNRKGTEPASSYAAGNKGNTTYEQTFASTYAAAAQKVELPEPVKIETGDMGDALEDVDSFNSAAIEAATNVSTMWDQYAKNDQALTALGQVQDSTQVLADEQVQEYGLEVDESGFITVEEALMQIQTQQAALQTNIPIQVTLLSTAVDQEISALKQKIQQINDNPEIEPEVKEAQVEELEAQIATLEETQVLITSLISGDNTEAMSAIDEVKKAKIPSKSFSIIANNIDSVLSKCKTICELLDRIAQGATGTVNVNGSVNLPGAVNGTAHVLGTAYKTGSWGAPKTETSLVGELGPELLVRGNRWTTIGENGAEFTDIKKGDIIFNHKQTEDLLSKGYITGRGKAYAEGTAFASGSGSYKTYSFSSKSSSSSGSLKKAADTISKSTEDASEDFKEVFDWIAVRIEELTERIDLSSAKLENAVGHFNQNDIIDQLIDYNKQLYDNLIAGAKEYNDFAEELLNKVPQKYREKAKDGSISLEYFKGKTGDKAYSAIEEYREWVQKAAEVTQQAEETLTEISALAKQAIDNIQSDYENQRSLRDNRVDQLDAYNDLTETDLGAESENIYNALIAENSKIINILENQRNDMQAELNKRVESGEIKKYSQDWYDAVSAIAEADTEIIELTADTEDYQDAINDLHWDHFDNLISRLEAISKESENLIDILSSKDLFDKETYEWTDEGITALALYAQQLDSAEMQAKKYEEEIKSLNKNWQALGYTEQEYVEKLEDLKDGQYDAIKAYNDTKDAIKDLTAERVEAIKEGIQEEIDAYTELINKKKEELSAEKDLYDFQKGVADQQKNIADIERKLAALSADNSASARAQRAKLEAELAKAKQDLQDTYYDRSIQDQQTALDKELENFQEEKEKEIEGWDEYLEETEKIVSDTLDIVQANTQTVYNTLQEMGKEYSLSIADAITSPWKQGEYAIQSYSEQFGLSMSATVEELRKIAVEYKNFIAEIEGYGQKVVGTVGSNAQRYQDTSSSSNDSSSSSSTSNETEKAIKVGAKVNAGSAKIYSYAGAQSGANQYYADDPVYTVLAVNGNWVQVRHHKQSKGVTGWFKKSQLKAYAKGTKAMDKDQFALIDELGEELIIRPSNGRMAFFEKGTGVIPADLTENLMEWGELDPSTMLNQNKPEISMSPSVVNNNMELHIDASVGELIHVENMNGNNIAEVTKVVDKAWNKYMKDLNANIRRYANR